MSDQEFDFRKAPERKERPRFEPPPWERDAFEELQARRAAEQAALEAAAEAPESGDAAGTASEPAVTERPAVAPAVPPVTRPATQPESVEPAGEVPVVADDGEAAKRAAQVELMMMQLAAEEPRADKAVVWVTGGTALLVGPLGLVMIVWGMAGMVKAGAAAGNAGLARTIAVILLAFGVMFVALAMWLVYRLLKRRGV